MSALSDNFQATLLPLLRLKPRFALRDGVFSPLERAIKRSENLIFAANPERPENFYTDFLNSIGIDSQVSEAEPGQETKPAELLSNIPQNIETDLELLSNDFEREARCDLKGRKLYVHPSSKIAVLAHIDSTDGPVVIDENVQISPFTLIKGPAYLGPGCIIDRASISNCILGRQVRLGGEVSDSIFGDFSNKHHEGFIGHSLVGDWVNLGAITTTSDLKNNYGEIKLQFGQHNYASGEIKFGSIIGDYVKTAIGTMLNTGTIIDLGSLLYSGRIEQKYYPPFFWGGAEPTSYDFKRFLQDAQRIMQRRKQQLTDFQRQQLQLAYSTLQSI